MRVAVALLVVSVALIAWQMAFFYGSRQSNDLLLESPNAADEVIQLRAQLEEARTYQTTLLNVVLTSFAAGFTVLVVVNFAVLFIAQRNYDREEKRMREFLILEAEKRDEARAKAEIAELRRVSQALEERLRKRIESVVDEQHEVRGNIGALFEHSISHYQSMANLSERLAAETASRRRQELEIHAIDAERDADHVQAAYLRSRILQSELDVPGGLVSWSNLSDIIRHLDALEKDPPRWFSRRSLVETKKALTAARDLEGMNEATAELIARGVATIEALGEHPAPFGDHYGNPSLVVPPPPGLTPPPTAPLRAPLPKRPQRDSEGGESSV